MNQGRSTDSGGAAEAWAAPQQGELVFYKHAYDAIGMDCGLEGHLKQRGIRSVIVGGMVTSCCVLQTACSLFARGFRTFVLSDCCADRDIATHTAALQRENRRSFGAISLADLADCVAQGGEGSHTSFSLTQRCPPNVTQCAAEECD